LFQNQSSDAFCGVDSEVSCANIPWMAKKALLLQEENIDETSLPLLL